MMTTMAALLGGVPLALGGGVGSELRRPLGITIIGGLLFSQVLTLYTTPVIIPSGSTGSPPGLGLPSPSGLDDGPGTGGRRPHPATGRAS